jgi:hypothetical protein
MELNIAESIGRIGAIPTHLILGTPEAIFNSPEVDKINTFVTEEISSILGDNFTLRVGHDDPANEFRKLVDSTQVHPVVKYTIGSIATLCNSVSSPFFRKDYYNPYTHTAVVYHSSPSILAHELGHAEFYSKSDMKELILLLQLVPVVSQFIRVYLEYKASEYALKNIELNDPDSLEEYEPILERSLYSYIASMFFNLLGKSGYIYFSVILLGYLVSMTKKPSLFRKNGSKELNVI